MRDSVWKLKAAWPPAHASACGSRVRTIEVKESESTATNRFMQKNVPRQMTAQK
jgi:hypothetical protein